MDLRAGAGGSPIMIRCKGKKKEEEEKKETKNL